MTNNRLINEIKKIILKYAKPERIYLYGSRANGEAAPASDIDIAYDDPAFKDNYIILEKVREIETLIKIDITNIAFTEERFRNRVKSTGIVIYSSTKKLRAEDALYNYSKALERFSHVVDKELNFKEDGYEDVYLDLIVKRFEFTYEMSWKALKRYLSFTGIEAENPRSTFREGFAQGVIVDEGIWLEMIEQRNLSSHVYDEYQIKEILDKKEIYRDAFIELKNRIERGLSGDIS